MQATLAIAAAIIAEASLSFLGLGQQPPAPSWGSMLNAAQRFLTQAPWLAIFPGLAIFLAVLAFNLVGDGLRDALDPRERAAVAGGGPLAVQPIRWRSMRPRRRLPRTVMLFAASNRMNAALRRRLDQRQNGLHVVEAEAAELKKAVLSRLEIADQVLPIARAEGEGVAPGDDIGTALRASPYIRSFVPHALTSVSLPATAWSDMT